MKQTLVRRLALYGSAGAICATVLGLSIARGPVEADTGTLLNGADVLARVGAHAKARENLEIVLRREPENAAAHLILGFTYEAEQRFAEALETYRKIRGRIEDRALLKEVDLSIADLNRRLGRRDEALKALETVERVHGPDARIHLVRGLIHNSAGDHQQALPELEQARGTPSTEDAACYHIGLTLRALGKTQEAISIFEMLTRRNARDFDAWYEIARCRLLLADRAGMFAALDRAAGVSRTRIRKRLTVDPDFQEVREDPRFRQVTEG